MSKSKVVHNVGKVTHFTPTNEYSWDSNHYVATHEFIQSEFSHVLGRVLTVIDASITGSQNKAIKDIIKGIFIDEYTHLTDMLVDAKHLKEISTLSDDEFETIVSEVDTDEALGIK